MVVEGVGCWLRLCGVAGDTSEARLMDATAGATTGGAAGAFATALAAMAFFKGMLDKMQAKLVGAGHSDTDCWPYHSLAKPRRRHNTVYSLNNAWEANFRCML